MGRATPIIIILCLLVVPAGVLTLGGLPSDNMCPVLTSSDRNTFGISYESHEAINIGSDAEFASLAAEEGWLGNGAQEAPYIIEGYWIQDYCCIQVCDVDSYFVINNCYLGSTGDGIGVYLTEAPNGRIESCDIHSTGWGIYISHSSGVYIHNNTIWDVYDGIALSESSECIIDSNHLTNASLEIYATGPEHWLHNVTGNYVNGEQLGYFREQSDITVDASSCGQVILAHCQNVQVKNGVFYGIGTGIALGYCQGCFITDCESTANSLGIFVDHSTEGLISECRVTHNSYYGIQLNQSASWNVSAIEASMNCYTGLLAMESPLILQGSTITHSEVGVVLVNSNESVLLGNQINYNQVGVCVMLASSICFESNAFMYNSEYGLYIYSDCVGCHIYYNYFFDNGIENAFDNGYSNTWDNSDGTGNWWSDYSGAGVYYINGTAGSVDRYPMHIDKTTTVTTSSSTTTTSSTTTGLTTTTTTNTTFGDIPVIISASVTVGAVAIIVVFGYALARGRGPRSYQ